jgi:hypothetical protein
MQQWEYCAISYVEPPSFEKGLLEVRYPILKRFTEDGGVTEGFDVSRGWADISQAIYQLGEQGWEMVGCSDTASYHIIYFKRPKQ